MQITFVTVTDALIHCDCDFDWLPSTTRLVLVMASLESSTEWASQATPCLRALRQYRPCLVFVLLLNVHMCRINHVRFRMATVPRAELRPMITYPGDWDGPTRAQQFWTADIA